MKNFTFGAWVAVVLLVSLAGGYGQSSSSSTSGRAKDTHSKTNVIKMGAVRRLDVVYDNTASTNFTGQYHYSTNEFGDQIALTPSNTNRYMAKFTFGYYLGDTATGNEKFVLRFYKNDGPKDAPGTLLWPLDPQPKSMPLKQGYNSAVIEGLALLVPDNFTFTVEFVGVKRGVPAGLLIFGPPVVGFSLDDYWEKVNGKWTLKIVAGHPINFGAQVIATDVFEAAGAGATVPTPIPPDNPEPRPPVNPIYNQL
jgi:hypothetical protein